MQPFTVVAIELTLFSDPGCPWAYSENPALSVLRWRYADQLAWRLVTIGLSERAEDYARRGYTPARVAHAYRGFRRYGMPFTTQPRRRVPATARACRAVVAVRLTDPGRELAAFRALQFAWFTSDLVPDEDDDIAAALSTVDGLDVRAIVAALDDPDVAATYEADRAEARSAAGGPSEFQGKARTVDGVVRYTAPSVVLTSGDRRLEAGGFQPVEAYDVLIANLDPSLARRPAAESALAAIEALPDGLTTQEIAAVMTSGNDAPDRARAEAELIELAAEGAVTRLPLADDALWRPARVAQRELTGLAGRAA